MVRRLRAAFFDMGGTLVEGPSGEDPWHAAVMARVTREFGPSPWAEALYKTNLWPRSSEPHRQETDRWMSEWLRERDLYVSDLQVERLRAAFAAPLPKEFVLTPGAVESLRWCKAQDLSVAVLTNTLSRGDAEVRGDWERLGLDDCVDCVVSSYSAGWAKPHPEMFERALAFVGTAPAETVMIGDEFEADIQGAKRAGMRAIWVSPGRGERPDHAEPPDAIISSLLELPRVLDQWLVEPT